MAVEKKEGTAIRKRQQIQDSNRAMFFWVAGVSVVVGFALVISWFLWQQITFKNTVIGEKHSTIDTLKDNITAADELRSNIRVLETNTALNDSKADSNEKALQVVLDALPADANSLALGASIQQRLARGVSGVNIESLSVMPAGSEADGYVAESTEGVQNTISFRMVAVSRNANSLRDLLDRFERSIRVINFDEMNLERSQSEYTLSIEGHAYYEPGKVVELRNKVVKP